MIDQGEEIMRALGFRQTRVRHHGDIARIEIAREELTAALNLETFDRISSDIQENRLPVRRHRCRRVSYRRIERNPHSNFKAFSMKILVVGSGGREHAVVDALSQSPESLKIYAAPGNGGIRAHAELVPLAADDVWSLLEFARNETIDLTFVGPEVPLSKGIVDIFRKNGLRIVGPTAEARFLNPARVMRRSFLKESHSDGRILGMFHRGGSIHGACSRQRIRL